MAEKRVSVRLAAVGGRQVRAELEGVGEAGARGFGRLSREMEAANTRLAGLSRRIAVAMGAAVAAAIPAMGAITNATIRAAVVTQQLAQVANATPESFQRWAGAARTVGIEEEKLADILKDVNDRVGDFMATGGGPMADFFENVAPKVGVTAEQFARLSGPEALLLYVDSLERAGLGQQEMTFYLEAMASDVTRLLPLLRNGGTEMARLGQQAEDLGAVMDSRTIRTMQRAQIALVGVGQVFEGMRNQIGAALAPMVTDLADAFVRLASSGGMLRTAFRALIDNLDRLATYAGTFVAFLAGRWVAGLVAAAVSVRGLATALVVLRGAIIRTGIGALIVGAGELVYQFGRLVAGAGGFGEALSLLGNVATEVWERIKLGGRSLALSLKSVWATIEAGWLTALSGIQRSWADFLHAATRGLDGVPGMESTMLSLSEAAIRAGSALYETSVAAGEASARADGLAASAEAAASAATAPLKSLQALRDAVAGSGEEAETAMTGATVAAEQFDNAVTGAGRTSAAAAPQVAEASEAAKSGWQLATDAVRDYADKAKETGQGVGEVLTSGFRGAEDAVAEFVKTGKLGMRDLITSILADLARVSVRRFVLGPIANALGGVLGSLGPAFAGVLHAGGMAGSAGPQRLVPAMAFAGAPRLHAGGVAGLRPDEVPAILRRGERVLSRAETRAFDRGQGGGGITVNIMTNDAESFRRSRTQVASDIARAVAFGRRGM